MREILADIVNDDQRAGEIIQRMRSMLERRETDVMALDMNGLILLTLVLKLRKHRPKIA